MAKKAAKKSVKKAAKAAPKKKSAKKPAKSAKKAPKLSALKKDGELSVTELAEQEGISVELVRQWCRDGRIKARQVKQPGAKRGTWFVPKSTFKRPADNRANNGRKPGTKNKPKKAGSKKKAA